MFLWNSPKTRRETDLGGVMGDRGLLHFCPPGVREGAFPETGVILMLRRETLCAESVRPDGII
jgi:hypothetical protein